ncbi:MAG: serine hydrolase [Candidatus Saccharimonadales bacterium]
MKNYEVADRTFDRRKFITAAGLSMIALAGCANNVSAEQKPSTSLISTEIPLAPPTPEMRDVKPELERAWSDIIHGNQEKPGRRGRIDIAVFDSKTGQISNASSNDSGRFKTASIIKLSILEKLLMDQPDWVRQNIDYLRPMITLSDNTIAQKEWSKINKNGNEMQEFFNTIGAPGIIAGPGGNLFSTLTTATEQLAVVNNFAYSTHMRPEDSALTRDLLHQVVPSQRWGVTGGVPSNVMVELKNGWVGERRNSIGHVSGEGVDYTIAALTDDGGSDAYDIETIEQLSAATWQIMRKNA